MSAVRVLIVPYVLVAPEVRPRKRLRLDNAQVKDKFNLSNDQFYDVSKDGRHRVRQTFGDLVVEHAYPAQKLQLPFVSRFCEVSSGGVIYGSTSVQDTLGEAGGTVFPSTGTANPCEY